MREADREGNINFIELTADIVSAYAANNSIPVGEVTKLLRSVHAAVSGLAAGGASVAATDEIEKATPAQIRKSITQDALISFEDGKPYKTLRRHLTMRGLTPEAYRVKHGLPFDYPMTSPTYSAQRSELARSFGLGKSRKAAAKVANAEPKRAGRPRKAAATTE